MRSVRARASLLVGLPLFLVADARLHQRYSALSHGSASQAKATEASDLCQPPTALPCDKQQLVGRQKVEFHHAFNSTPLALHSTPESGYVPVTDRDYLFFLFFSPHKAAPADAPLLVWSNGGPGCSSMEGATTGLSPIMLFNAKPGAHGGFSRVMTSNHWGWHRHAALLFVDQPRYVGFSTGTGPYVTTSREAGLDMVVFLRRWRRLFPEHAHRSLIFASESYGGHYVPAWVDATLNANAAPDVAHEDVLPLRAIYLGNALVNRSVQQSHNSWNTFCHAEGIISPSVTSESIDKTDVVAHLGYEPNMYDFRLESQDGCGAYGYDYSRWASTLYSEPFRRALHVCGKAGADSFAGCTGGCHVCIGNPPLLPFDEQDEFEYSAALSRALQAGLRLTFVYGKNDLAVPYVGGHRMVMETLEWGGASAFRAAPLEPLLAEGTIEIGQVQRHGLLTYMQIEDSGHMVFADQPAAGILALQTLLPDMDHLTQRAVPPLLVIGALMLFAALVAVVALGSGERIYRHIQAIADKRFGIARGADESRSAPSADESEQSADDHYVALHK